ncbi:MAG TPA: sugar transferase [Bacteroidia bacterium]|jgi:hypothetical protein|nr:sugar transferase [Bacteroidia bacterium]
MNQLDLPIPPALRELSAPKHIKPNPPVNGISLLKRMLMEEGGKGVSKFVTEQIDLQKKGVLILGKAKSILSDGTNTGQIRSLVDLNLLNKRRGNLDVFLKDIYTRLPDAGIYIGCLESNSIRKEKIFRAYPTPLARICWTLDFLFNRVLPKLALTRGLYRLLCYRRPHYLSKAEALGRLSYAGFEIIGHELIQHRFYFSVIRVEKSLLTSKPSLGLLFKMPRVSKGGKIVGIYKIRSMHPYSEFLQNYVVKMNGYNEVGKPNRDFRLTRWGKVFRKLHLDELPQLLNVLKGDLHIIGVRPLSKFGFEALPPDLQAERILYKPGCIPPNVALGLTGFKGVIQAERIYLADHRKYGSIVRVRYFWLAIYHLLLRKNESA